MKYYSEVTGAIYDTEEELMMDEAEIARKEMEEEFDKNIHEACRGVEILEDVVKMVAAIGGGITGDTEHQPIYLIYADRTMKKFANLHEVYYHLKKEMEKREAQIAEDEE